MCSIQCNRGLGDEDGHDGDYDQMQQGIPFKNNGHSVVGVQRLKNPGKTYLFLDLLPAVTIFRNLKKRHFSLHAFPKKCFTESWQIC